MAQKTLYKSVLVASAVALIVWIIKNYIYPYIYSFFHSLVGKFISNQVGKFEGRNFSTTFEAGKYYSIVNFPRNLDYSRFDSPDLVGSGRLTTDGGKMQPDFLIKFCSAEELYKQIFKDMLGFYVSSGFRTKAHNATLAKASPTSLHMSGRAIDISRLNADRLHHTLACVVQAGLSARLYKWGVDKYHLHCDDRAGSPKLSFDKDFPNELKPFYQATFDNHFIYLSKML